MENINQKKYNIYIREVLEEVSKDIILPLYGNLSKTQISTKSNNNDRLTSIIKDFNSFVRNDDRVEKTILPLGDGITVCRKI